MGNEESKPQLYTRISKALPPLAPQYGINENIDWVDKGTKAFASEGDREQFICTSKVTKPLTCVIDRRRSQKGKERVTRTTKANRTPCPLSKQTPSSPS
jgi:hypothetical protein